MACNIVTEILGNECIGDSRGKINTNFSALETAVCSLSTNTINVVDTTTIDLDYTSSSRVISGTVKTNSIDSTHLKSSSVTTSKIAPDTIRYSQLASWQTLSASPTLSAEAITPRLVTAYADFKYSTTAPYIVYQDTYNISSIEMLTSAYGPASNTLGWRLHFARPMKNERFLTFCGDYAGYSVLDSGTGFAGAEPGNVNYVEVAAGHYNGYRYRFLIISQYE